MKVGDLFGLAQNALKDIVEVFDKDLFTKMFHRCFCRSISALHNDHHKEILSKFKANYLDNMSTHFHNFEFHRKFHIFIQINLFFTRHFQVKYETGSLSLLSFCRRQTTDIAFPQIIERKKKENK